MQNTFVSTRSISNSPKNKAMLRVTEEFSFPKVSTNPIPHFTISPSLWRVSSLVYPDDNNLDEDNNVRDGGDGFCRNSCAYLEESKIKRETTTDGARLESSEEKMDMLWEDFNEEIHTVDKKKEAKSKRLSRSRGLDSQSEDLQMVEFCCLQALKMSKTSKRTNMVVVMKALKKFFFLRN